MTNKRENTEETKSDGIHSGKNEWDDPEGLTVMEGFFTEYNSDIATRKEGAK